MIRREEVLHLAELARFKLSDTEIESLQKDISAILEYVGQVSSTTLGAPDMRPPLRNVMRDDARRAEGDLLSDKEESLRAAFPTREGNFNVVRKIIQKDE